MKATRTGGQARKGKVIKARGQKQQVRKMIRCRRTPSKWDCQLVIAEWPWVGVDREESVTSQADLDALKAKWHAVPGAVGMSVKPRGQAQYYLLHDKRQWV